MFVPDPVKSQVLSWAHSSKLTCHPGLKQTLAFLKQHFWWLSVPRRPWSHLALDFVTDLPTSAGKTVVLTIVDQFSKFARFSIPSAKETAEMLVKEVFCTYGLPSDTVSDCGPQFTSAMWKAFCTSIGATISLTLRCTVCRHFSVFWDISHPFFLQWRSSFCILCVTWYCPFSVLLRALNHYKHHTYCCHTPAPHYHSGDKVWLSTKDLPLKTDSKKLFPKFIGPFEVLHINNPNAIRLKEHWSLQVHPVFNVSFIKTVSSSPLVPPPLPREINDHPAFTMCHLQAFCSHGRGAQYLVDQEGYIP